MEIVRWLDVEPLSQSTIAAKLRRASFDPLVRTVLRDLASQGKIRRLPVSRKWTVDTGLDSDDSGT
jgi:hypothetical protein